jgi:hypothetical protein
MAPGSHHGAMTSMPLLPELAQNAALLDYRRAQRLPARDWPLGEWELNTHPDLMERLAKLAPDQTLYNVYGVPALASEGIAAAVAIGTSWLLVRLPSIPEDLEAGDPLPPLTDQDWMSVNPWQIQLSTVEGTRRLSDVIRSALDHARSLAR